MGDYGGTRTVACSGLQWPPEPRHSDAASVSVSPSGRCERAKHPIHHGVWASPPRRWNPPPNTGTTSSTQHATADDHLCKPVPSLGRAWAGPSTSQSHVENNASCLR
ncbi:hypothetical protein P280DRAFT_31606 [Massarina eburnea CBS 473.64]|uniref:Uncharacterized protein n=1 Tax=Massarina eburnea CBS 473.64 TaxID=1395130 RepID=A0A6A6RXJ8_9PLEO|nr:hypothetical protein P280DRAFT_31606 [Massarina eburnea CBS 473.64]